MDSSAVHADVEQTPVNFNGSVNADGATSSSWPLRNTLPMAGLQAGAGPGARLHQAEQPGPLPGDHQERKTLLHLFNLFL